MDSATTDEPTTEQPNKPSTVSVHVVEKPRPTHPSIRTVVALKDRDINVWNLSVMASVDRWRLALGIYVIVLEFCIVGIFFGADPNGALAQSFPHSKSLIGFVFGSLMIAYWNRVMGVIAMTKAAMHKFVLVTQQEPAEPVKDFPGMEPSNCQYYTVVIPSCFSCIGSIAFTVLTSLAVKQTSEYLDSGLFDYNLVAAIVSLYSLVLIGAFICVGFTWHGTYAILLLLKSMPQKLYPIGITTDVHAGQL